MNLNKEYIQDVIDQTLRVSGIAPGLDELNIEVVARGLAREQRFGNRLPKGCDYSVAEHSIVLSRHGDPKFAMFKLLHDATEFLFRDIPGPIKALMPQYKEVETAAFPIILKAIGSPVEAHEKGDYKIWDNRLCVFEAFSLFKTAGVPKHIRKHFPKLKLERMKVEEATEAFLKRYEELKK